MGEKEMYWLIFILGILVLNGNKSNAFNLLAFNFK